MSEEQVQLDEGVIVMKGGKRYKTVANRVVAFREATPLWTIRTEILERTDSVVLIRAEILDETGRLLADGLAEEDRTSSLVNKTSAVENCQTSAIGRALATLGYVGVEFASEQEVVQAKAEQSVKVEFERMVAHTQALLEHYGVVMAIKAAIAEELSELATMERTVQIEDAAQSWFALGQDAQNALWRAPTKGGAFTTKEAAFIKAHFRRLAYGEQS